MRVQSATVIGNSAKHYCIFTKTTTVVRVIAEFTGHKTNSVRLVRFKMCFSSSDTSTEFLLPEIHVKHGGQQYADHLGFNR